MSRTTAGAATFAPNRKVKFAVGLKTTWDDATEDSFVSLIPKSMKFSVPILEFAEPRETKCVVGHALI